MGRTEARFDLPTEYLSFASREQLVLSVPQTLSSPQHAISAPGGRGPSTWPCTPCADETSSNSDLRQEPPLVSGMHLVTDAGQTVSIRSVTGGAPKAVIGFNSPARTLVRFAFRRPALVVVETTSTPRLPSEVHYWSGDYGPASEPFLGIFDLAHSEPFVPAPALAHVEPNEPLTDCGPPPP
jgi:hypothetical protein